MCADADPKGTAAEADGQYVSKSLCYKSLLPEIEEKNVFKYSSVL